MYSGTTLTKHSGRILGAHQKIDRIARRHLEHLAPANRFPIIGSILHFEGGNGPDAIKRKSPAKDEPWHYFQPFDMADKNLLHIIQEHYDLLVSSLREGNDARASFEAAWLAHAIVDGLTPAHHFPYEQELELLRSGESRDTRTTIKEKLVMHGDTHRDKFKNNWKMWGPKGLFINHSAFEWGVATLMLPLKLTAALPTPEQISNFHKAGIAVWFRATAQEIANMGLYDSFCRQGWTAPLARLIRRELAPNIVRAVTLTWYSALMEAQKPKS